MFLIFGANLFHLNRKLLFEILGESLLQLDVLAAAVNRLGIGAALLSVSHFFAEGLWHGYQVVTTLLDRLHEVSISI